MAKSIVIVVASLLTNGSSQTIGNAFYAFRPFHSTRNRISFNIVTVSGAVIIIMFGCSSCSSSTLVVLVTYSADHFTKRFDNLRPKTSNERISLFLLGARTHRAHSACLLIHLDLRILCLGAQWLVSAHDDAISEQLNRGG